MKIEIKNFFSKYKYQIIGALLISLVFLIVFFVSNGIISSSGDEFSQYRSFYIGLTNAIKNDGFSFYLSNIFNGSNLISFYYYVSFDILGLIRIGLTLISNYDVANLIIYLIIYITGFITFYVFLKPFKIKDYYKFYIAMMYSLVSFSTFAQYPNFLNIIAYLPFILIGCRKILFEEGTKKILYFILVYLVSLNVALSNIYIAFITFLWTNILLVAYYFVFNKDKITRKALLNKLLNLFIIDVIFLLATLGSAIFNLPFIYYYLTSAVARESVSFLVFYPLNRYLILALQSLIPLPINIEVAHFDDLNYVLYQGSFFIGTISLIAFLNIFFVNNKKKYIPYLLLELLIFIFPIFALISNAFTQYYLRFCIFYFVLNIFIIIDLIENCNGEILLFKEENKFKLLILVPFYLIYLGIVFIVIKTSGTQNISMLGIASLPLGVVLVAYLFKNKALYLEVGACLLILFQQSYTSTRILKINNDNFVNNIDKIIVNLKTDNLLPSEEKIRVNSIDLRSNSENYYLTSPVTFKSKYGDVFHSFLNKNLSKYYAFINNNLMDEDMTWAIYSKRNDVIYDFYDKTNYQLILKSEDMPYYYPEEFYDLVKETDDYLLLKSKYETSVTFLNKNDEASSYLNINVDSKEVKDDKIYYSLTKEFDNFSAPTTYELKDGMNYYTFDYDLTDLKEKYLNSYVSIISNTNYRSFRIEGFEFVLVDNNGQEYSLANDSFILKDNFKTLRLKAKLSNSRVYNNSPKDYLEKMYLEEDLYIQDTDYILEGLKRQVELNQYVNYSLSNDVLKVDIDEAKIKEDGVNLENYVVSIPYVYDEGWGEEKIFAKNGLISFTPTEDFTLTYKPVAFDTGLYISIGSIFVSMALLGTYAFIEARKQKNKNNIIND